MSSSALAAQCDAGAGDLGGQIWRDFNANGMMEPGEAGFQTAGMSVKAYDDANTVVATATLNADGSFLFPAIFNTQKALRIEFEGIPAYMSVGASGVEQGTSVQRHMAASCSANLGVNNPVNYCQANPDVAISTYGAGSSVGDTRPGIVHFPANSAGFEPTANDVDAAIGEVGAVWGAAYQRSNKLLFASSVLRRHAGFADGPGYVYVLDYKSNPSGIAGKFNLQGVSPANGGAAINLGSINRTEITGAIQAGAAGDNELSSIVGEPSRDLDAFAKVGRISYGDASMSEDGQTLWLVNLSQRALISVDVSQANPAQLPASLGAINQYPLAGMAGLPVCTNGEYRPWAIKLYEGKGYVGLVCDASTGTAADLHAHVLSFDPANPVALTPVVDFALDYPREPSIDASLADGSFSDTGPDKWSPWSTTTPTIQGAYGAVQPVLSNIEFGLSGSLELAFMDRVGMQLGTQNYAPISGNTSLYGYIASGDLLHFCKVNGAFVQEGAAGCAVADTSTAYGNLNNDGLSGQGEFYHGDSYAYSEGAYAYNLFHGEHSLGAIATIPGTDKIINTAYDPVQWQNGGGANSQGIEWFSTQDGSAIQSYVDGYLVVPTNIAASGFAKSIGMGELELLCDEAPLQVGNYVWQDTDGDGLQDPSEQGIAGVQVELWSDPDTVPGNTDDVLVQTIRTDAQGKYYFSVSPSSTYYLAIPAGSTAIASMNLTQKDAAGATAAVDDTDSDAAAGVVAGKYIIPFASGLAGRNDYSLDAGFTPQGSIGNYVWLDENSDGFQDEGERGIPNVQVKAVDGNGKIYTTLTDAAGGYLLTGLPFGTYTVSIPAENQLAGAALEGMFTTAAALTGKDGGNQNAAGYAVVIGNGQPTENLTADFGYNYRPTVDVDTGLGLAALGDRVWVDSDGDGVQDAGEVPVSGVTLTLYSDPDADGVFNTVVDTAVTDAHGHYLFDDLPAAAYVVTVTSATGASHPVLGAGYSQTGDPDHFSTNGGVNDHTSTVPVVLAPGDVFLNVDFGYRPVTAPVGSIGDTVWFDADADGNGSSRAAIDGGAAVTQGAGGNADAGDNGIPGVSVSLIRDTNGNGRWDTGEPVLATTLTNQNGQYLFSGLSLDDGDGDADYLVWVNDTANVLGELTAVYDQNGLLPGIGLAGGLGVSAVALNSTTPDDRLQDFGYTAQTLPVGSIGDTVWFDADASGGNQATRGAEPGIDGVTVLLYADKDQNGTPDDLNGDGAIDVNDALDSTTTNAAGSYLFDGLPLGAYLVGVDTGNLPPVLNPAATYEPDGDTDGFGQTVVLSEATPSNRDQDFSFRLDTNILGSIGDQIWEDVDDNGLNQPGAADKPLGGVTVTLTDGAGAVVQVTRTNDQGYYLFTLLPAGTYNVVVNTDTLPSGLQTTPTYEPEGDGNSSSAYALATGEHNRTQDFSYRRIPAMVHSIGDTVWFDVDKSGGDQSTQGSEPGLAGVRVDLFGPVSAASYTNIALTGTVTSGGSTGAAAVIDGTAVQTLPNLWVAEDVEGWVQIDVGSVQPIESIKLWSDSDDGLYPNLYLLVSDTPFTDFSSLAAVQAQADYSRQVIDAYVWNAVREYDVSRYGRYILLYTPDANGWVSMAEIEVFKVATVTTGYIGSTRTDEKGYYLFDGLEYPGGYVVSVDTSTLPAYVSKVSTHDGTDGGSDSLSASMIDGNNPHRRDQDFSYPPLVPGAIGDTVWFDLDGSGGATQGGGESGIEGVLMTLNSTGGVSQSTRTDENGHYYFGDLPLGQTYTVTVDPVNFLPGGVLEGMAETYDQDAVLDNSSSTTLTVAQPIDLTQDFSYRGNAANTLGSLGNRVWLDQNADGDWDGVNGPDGLPGTDDDEIGFPGVTLDLYRDLNANGAIDAGEPLLGTKMTDNNGLYLFYFLPLGSYVVDVTDRAGVLNGYWHSLGTQPANTNSGSDANDQSKADPFGVTLTAGIPDNQNVDFGYYVEPAAVGNYVWVDTNNDGLQNDGEQGLNGVKVTLVIDYPNGAKTTLTTLTTNDAGGNPGYYQFGNLLLDEDEHTGGNIEHTVSVDTGQAVLTGYSVAKLDVAGGTADLNDSDDPAGVQAMPVQGLIDTSALDPVVNEAGVSSYDFGFVQTLVDIQLQKTVSPLTARRGDTVTYTLTATNAGNFTANGVVVNDLLSAGVTFVSATPSQGTYDAVSGNWAVGVLAPGASSTLQITVLVK